MRKQRIVNATAGHCPYPRIKSSIDSVLLLHRGLEDAYDDRAGR